MRTRTIYQALDCVRESSAFFATEKRVRQAGTFERELLRRMDERDALAAKAKAWDALQKWKALDNAGFCSYYDLNKAKDAADAAASEVA